MLSALNADAPVIVSWLVDFNALDNVGAFRMSQLERAGRPGRQGGHMTVLHDYQVRFADGRVLAAGTPASPADRERAPHGHRGVSPREELLGREPLRPRVAAGLLRPRPRLPPRPHRLDQRVAARVPSQQSPLNEMILPPGF
jgi:hypothetical protein